MNTTLPAQVNQIQTTAGKVRSSWRRWTAGILLAVSMLSSGGFSAIAEANDLRDPVKITAASARVRMAETDIYERALDFTCWIKVPGADGEGASMGTGWVVDKERKLVMTNHHVIESGTGKRNDVLIWFPTEEDGELLNDHIHYERNITPVRGTVIDSDSSKDLALIQLNSVPDTVKDPVIATKSPRPGSHIHTVAGLAEGSQALWVYTTGVVKQVYKKRSQLSDNQVVFARVVEAQAAVNRGNSGGAVLDDHGEVIAVISSGSSVANSVESFIDQKEIHNYLEIVLPLVDPQTADNFNTRGLRHYFEGRYDQAISDFNAALRLDGELGDAYSNRAWAQMQNGEYQIALGDFSDAIRHDATLTDAWQGRGIVHRELNNVEESLRDMSEAIRRDNGSDTLYNLYNERGITQYWAENYADALVDFERAAELAEQDGGNFGNFTELVRAVEIERDQAQLHVNCGDALMGLDRLEDAMKRYDTALDLAPSRWDILFKIGSVHESNGDLDKAVQLYKAVIENDQSDPQFYRSLGQLLRTQDQLKSSAETLAEGADRHTDNSDLANELGITFFQGEAYQNAIVAFDAAIERDNQNAVYFRNRGHAYSKVDDYSSAIADMDRAIHLDKSDPEFFFLRGQIREFAGDAEAAQPDYDRAERMDSTTFKRQFRRFLQLENRTEQKITVVLKYETMTTEGTWQWFGADDGGGLIYELEPGQKVNVYHDEFRINARRIQIAAVAADKTEWESADVKLVSTSGYITTDYEPESWDTFVYFFAE
ncbi:MAG: tetratricopeptide repeat protein [Pirellulales bacterium]|nr:tetratricopeptide repeat protein [Pirellulales bacterium]